MNTSRYQRVKCISAHEQNSIPEVGNYYILDLLSVYMDSDGDAYRIIYVDEDILEYVGNRKLSHFMSVK